MHLTPRTRFTYQVYCTPHANITIPVPFTPTPHTYTTPHTCITPSAQLDPLPFLTPKRLAGDPDVPINATFHLSLLLRIPTYPRVPHLLHGFALHPTAPPALSSCPATCPPRGLCHPHTNLSSSGGSEAKTRPGREHPESADMKWVS